MLKLKWEKASQAISNTDWIMLHFTTGSVTYERAGSMVAFSGLNGYMSKRLKQLASQCGARIVKPRKEVSSQHLGGGRS